jgi:hypothetical protein
MVLRRGALLLTLSLALTACGNSSEEPGRPGEEPAREGLALELDGVNYNVFITRQLNPSIPPDSAYYPGPEPPRGQTLYGVFLQACNGTRQPQETARHFKVVDNQGNEFQPAELSKDNDFAYQPRRLKPDECIPQAGSVAQLGPTSGALLMFKLPLTITENRPLELEIEGGFNAAEAMRDTLSVELDI